MDNGLKPIKTVKVGDKVWAYDAKTKKFALKKVTHTFTVLTDSLFAIYTLGQRIEATPEHPFLVKGKWVNARNLRTGQYLTLYRGRNARIDSIRFIDKRTLTYNFTVANYHTYHVSKKKVVVHNSIPCPHGNAKSSDKIQHGYEIRDTKTGEVLEYGISGQPLNKNGTSPRVAQKLNKKYNGNPDVEGRVIEPHIGPRNGQTARENALDWEQGKVNGYSKSPNNPNPGSGPPRQDRPQPNM